MGPLTGPRAAVRASKLLIKHPKLFVLALVPALITFLVSCVGIWLAVSFGGKLIISLWPEPDPGWLHWVWYISVQLVRVFSALLAVFITPWLVVLLGIPLCSPLASATDAVLGGKEVPVSFVADLARTILAAICVTGVGLAGNTLLFMLGFIPGMGLITGPIAAFVWTPLILCYDLFDGAMSRRQTPYKTRVLTVIDRPMISLSVGLTALGLLAIPLINLIGLPIAVITGVIVIRDLEDAGVIDLGAPGDREPEPEPESQSEPALPLENDVEAEAPTPPADDDGPPAPLPEPGEASVESEATPDRKTGPSTDDSADLGSAGEANDESGSISEDTEDDSRTPGARPRGDVETQE